MVDMNKNSNLVSGGNVSDAGINASSAHRVNRGMVDRISGLLPGICVALFAVFMIVCGSQAIWNLGGAAASFSADTTVPVKPMPSFVTFIGPIFGAAMLIYAVKLTVESWVRD